MCLKFNLEFGALDVPDMPTTYRTAVRAVIMQNKKILLLLSSRGDCKLPGGGVEKDEDHEQALIREIHEETGYMNAVVNEKLGHVVERKMDDYDSSRFFIMESHYYACNVSGNQVDQKLDPYEEALGFTPKWMPLEEAIQMNKTYLEKTPDHKGWTQRENEVLNLLCDMDL